MGKFKTTSKEYQINSATKGQLVRANHKLTDLIRMSGNNDIHDLYTERESNIKLIEGLEKNYFALLPITNVKYSIGGRRYYREAVKIGKTYFERGEKLNKSNGIYCLEEIEEITEKMTKEMISDSYYY